MKRYFFRFKTLSGINIFFILLSSIMNVSLAFVLKAIVDVGAEGNLSKFYRTMLFSILYVFSTFLIEYLKRLLQAKLIKKTLLSLKEDVFGSILDSDISSFNEDNSAKYISTLTNDINMLEQDYFTNMLEMAASIISFIIATAAIITVNLYITIGVFILASIPILIPVLFGKKVSILKNAYSTNLGNFTTKVKDIFSGFEVVKSFNIEGKIKEEYNKSNHLLEDSKYKFSALSAIVQVSSMSFGFLMFFAAMGIGTYLIILGVITVGAMLAAVQLMNNIVNPIVNISDRLNRLKSIKLIEEKFLQIINAKKQADTGLEKISFEKEIKFDKVEFSYGDRKTLKGVSLTFAKGKKYAIVGGSGSGKSTILKLLLRYYENFTGDISIDGIQHKVIRKEAIYKLVSIIQQNVFMFDSSIRDNIALFQDYDDGKVQRAVELSGLKDLVDSLQDGISSGVGENGCNLSGGEKQRVAIARALIKNTPILVLDEATSALDNETSYSIENSMLNLPDLTCLVVTHKLMEEVLRKYDGIVAVKDGVIVEDGSFDELMHRKGYFHSLHSVAG
jgi:ATP-binding cassette, subfamily B, bacterial